MSADTDRDPEADRHREDYWRLSLLFHVIDNSQAVIRSSESRVPMALVLHGLIFTGLVAVTLKIGPIIASLLIVKILALIFFVMIGSSFLVSVFALIGCILPPSRMAPVSDDQELQIPLSVDPSVFFPAANSDLRFSPIYNRLMEPLLRLLVIGPTPSRIDEGERAVQGGTSEGEAPSLWSSDQSSRRLPSYSALRGRFEELNESRARELLIAEHLIVAMYRERKSTLVKLGFAWLMTEIVLAVLYLATLAGGYLYLHW